MLPIHNKIKTKNMFEHSNLANILVNKKKYYKKNHPGRGVTPRQIQLVTIIMMPWSMYLYISFNSSPLNKTKRISLQRGHYIDIPAKSI